MGRELKRVPLDFDWPIGKVWEGYLNPHSRKCPDCTDGSTVDAGWLSAIVDMLLLAGGCGTKGRTHPWLLDLPIHPKAPPTPHMEELTAGLAGRRCSFLGHDALDRWQAIKTIIKAAGLPEDWGTCKTCGGHAIDPAVKDAYDAWENEPHKTPEGRGYQLWETTSEGSPISPVFASLDELCTWAAENANTFGSNKASAAKWKSMLEEGFVCHQEGGIVFT
jgi:hypothetical protein